MVVHCPLEISRKGMLRRLCVRCPVKRIVLRLPGEAHASNALSMRLLGQHICIQLPTAVTHTTVLAQIFPASNSSASSARHSTWKTSSREKSGLLVMLCVFVNSQAVRVGRYRNRPPWTCSINILVGSAWVGKTRPYLWPPLTIATSDRYGTLVHMNVQEPLSCTVEAQHNSE